MTESRNKVVKMSTRLMMV